MTGLKSYDRDRDLPASAGQPELCLPTDEAVTELVREHLHTAGAPGIEATALEYARWKPHTSTTSGHLVRFEDGEEKTVILKRFVSGKDRHVADHFTPSAHTLAESDRLAPFAFAEDRGLCLWTFPADRALRGAARVMNMRRTARLVDSTQVFAPMVVRLRPSQAVLLRYKPERRAVFRLDLKLRGPDGERKIRRLGVRTLSVEVAAQVARLRHLCSPNERGRLAPELIHHEPETGILIEEWLKGDVPAPDTFEHAYVAGRCIAALHSLPAPEPVETASELAPYRALFDVDPGLTAAFARIPEPAAVTASAWVHGDFHPDQVLLEEGTSHPRLLDLDCLGPGDPMHDLASWVADHIAADPSVDFDAACAKLRLGYTETGRQVADDALSAEVGYELVRRAAAAIRRLERGAVEKAGRLLERAGAHVPTKASTP